MGALRPSEAGRMIKAPGEIVALPYLGVAEVRGLHVGQRRWHAEDVHAQGSEAEDVCEGPADLLSRSPGLGLGSHVRCTRVRAIVTKVLPAANRTGPGTMPNACRRLASQGAGVQLFPGSGIVLRRTLRSADRRGSLSF